MGSILSSWVACGVSLVSLVEVCLLCCLTSMSCS